MLNINKVFRKLSRNQKGFTLIELVIAIAIAGMITGGITTAIFQVFSGSARTSNHMTVVRQVQNAGYWISRDGQMAQSVVTTGVLGFPFTLTRTSWESGDVHEVVYTIVDNKLQRSHSVNGTTETGIVAQYIDPDETKFEFTAGGAFSLPDVDDAFTITDDVGGDSGTITVNVGSVTATPTGGATVAGGTDPMEITPDSGVVAWTTPAANDAVEVAANEASTAGGWTSTTATATAAITVDGDGNAAVAAGGVLVFRLTVTATVGSGSQEESETRVYKVASRSGL